MDQLALCLVEKGNPLIIAIILNQMSQPAKALYGNTTKIIGKGYAINKLGLGYWYSVRWESSLF